MDWFATLRRSGGLHALARQINASPADVLVAAGHLLPALLAAARRFVDRNGGGEQGVKALIDLLSTLGEGDLAAQVMAPNPLEIDPGERLLGELFLPEERVAALAGAADDAARNVALNERLLPGLAMLVGGYLCASAAGSGAETCDLPERLAEMLDLDVPGRAGGFAPGNRGN